MKPIESDWRELSKEEMTTDDIVEFMKLHCTFSIDINSKDPIMIDYIRKHKDWIKEKKPKN